MLLSVRSWPSTARSAPVALLVHGWHSDSRTWWRVGPALVEAGFQVLAVDLPGHGRTPAPGRLSTVEDWAHDLADTLDAHAPGRIALGLGHSAGAATVAELAFIDSGCFERIVLEEPPTHERRDPEEHLAWLAASKARADADADALAAEILGANPAWDRGDAREWLAALRAFDLVGMAPSARAGLGYRTAELVPRIEAPTLLLAGSEARGSVLRGAARRSVAGSLPSGRFVEIDAGHCVHRDRFADYCRLVRDWGSPSGGS